jgi:hypothetical protein
MKKPKRKKPEPKFRVGQVLMLKKEHTYHRVFSVWTHPDYEPFYSLAHHHSVHEPELRPLTAKEKGPRRNRGR